MVIGFGMEKATKLSTIGLGLSLGLAWSIGVLVVGVMALLMDQATVEPFKNLLISCILVGVILLEKLYL